MRLSPEEKVVIEKMRAEKEAKLPIKIGYAKEDLYQLSPYTMPTWWASKTEVESIKKDFEKHIELVVPVGSKFDCYLEDGIEWWYDRTGVFSRMSAKWAQANLKNIDFVKKNKGKKNGNQR